MSPIDMMIAVTIAVTIANMVSWAAQEAWHRAEDDDDCAP